MTEEEFRNILHEKGEEFHKLVSRIQRYNSNILGSNAYFYKKRVELEALFD